MTLSKRKLQEKDYSKALEIWEESVIATHDFLKEKDRLELKNDIPNYFKMVEVYLWFNDQEIIGFSGTNNQNLEMLFIRPKYFNNVYGTEIVQYLIQENKIQYVDVNKDNQKAIKFYVKNGFEIFGESQKDDQGRGYPILHLKL